MELREGYRVLDAGCGSGEDLANLAQDVGASGTAVGVDFDPDLLAHAQRIVEKENISNVIP